MKLWNISLSIVWLKNAYKYEVMALILLWSTASPDHCTICGRTCNSIVLSSQVSELLLVKVAHTRLQVSNWKDSFFLSTLDETWSSNVLHRSCWFVQEIPLTIVTGNKNIVKSAYNKRAITFDIHTPTALCSSPLRSITWSESLKNPWNSETLKNPPVLL